ncbi:MAG: hypothetical protein ABSH21_11970 [Verrucomicrobiia bacterium]
MLHKIFANPEPARLYIYHQKARIGFCRIAISPLASLGARPTDPVGQQPGAYRVQGSFTAMLPWRLKLIGDGLCDPQYEIQKFNVKTSLGEIRLDIRGDNQTRKVDLVYDDGDTRQVRQFGFNEVGGEDLASALGIPSPAYPALFGIAGLPTASGEPNAAVRTRSQLTTTAYHGHLPIGELTQRAYLIESKLNEGMWARIWIDESGQVLLVETSMGLTMRSVSIDDLDNHDRLTAVARSSRGGIQANHD